MLLIEFGVVEELKARRKGLFHGEHVGTRIDEERATEILMILVRWTVVAHPCARSVGERVNQDNGPFKGNLMSGKFCGLRGAGICCPPMALIS
jgi:hypothetical protein